MATNDSTLEEDMSGVECPIASFVRGLKTFETRHCIGGDGATCSGTMIVAFNKNRLTDVCYSNSPNYNPSLCDFDLIASEIFKGDETWVNRGLVKEVIDLLAKLHGWVAKLTQKYLQCNRYGTDDTSRQYAAGALKCDCTFRITLSAWKRDKHKKEATSTKAASIVKTGMRQLQSNLQTANMEACVNQESKIGLPLHNERGSMFKRCLITHCILYVTMLNRMENYPLLPSKKLWLGYGQLARS